jgi:hypothetical protein
VDHSRRPDIATDESRGAHEKTHTTLTVPWYLWLISKFVDNLFLDWLNVVPYISQSEKIKFPARPLLRLFNTARFSLLACTAISVHALSTDAKFWANKWKISLQSIITNLKLSLLVNEPL